MAQDIISQFYSCLNLPVQNKLSELARIIDQSTPNKDLQIIFPLLVNNIFGGSNSNGGWCLRAITFENNRLEFEMLHQFLEPQGPMFRLCYKLLADPQCKFNLPLQSLPVELQLTLERGRCTQFYADLLNVDTQSMNVVSLLLNPFDYYIFSFALHLLNANASKGLYDSVNTIYFTLVCDYLTHFLPTDPGVTVLPPITHFTGKVQMVAPLQTANRSFGSSLLLKPDLLDMNNQHTPSQSDSRNEIWRTETVLQVFIDLWMSVDDCRTSHVDLYQRAAPTTTTNSERVRTVRVLVKHILAYSWRAGGEGAAGGAGAALRRYARQAVCVRGYRYVRALVAAWPLDASFRAVLELWLSLLQPWRYKGNDGTLARDRYSGSGNNQQEDNNTRTVDASYTQFIAEYFPSYTCILQMILPRFMRLDLTSPKNAIMLFRLGKVFSQPHLVYILRDLEQAVVVNDNEMYLGADSNNYSNQSYTDNNLPPNRWGSLAKQSISELNLSPNYCYEPIWTENAKPKLIEFLKRIMAAKNVAEQTVEEHNKKLAQQNRGFWAMFNFWSLMGIMDEEEISLEEYRKVPNYLNASIQYFSNIFDINEITLAPQETILEDSLSEQSSYMNSSNFTDFITKKLRSKSCNIQYMGDPDLMPITSYESMILVRMLYQISTKINEMYGDEFERLWSNQGFWGYVAREVLQSPRGPVAGRGRGLPARLSLRRLGSHATVVWLTLGYLTFMALGFGGLSFLFLVLSMWMALVLAKATAKAIGVVKSD